jgi:epoxyqueuosine reductase QueG
MGWVDSGIGDPAGGLRGFKRTVALALGNWLAAADEPSSDAVEVLREALEDEEPLVRDHAKWALDQRVIR